MVPAESFMYHRIGHDGDSTVADLLPSLILGLLNYPEFLPCSCRRFFGFPSDEGDAGTPEHAPIEVRYCSAFAIIGDRFSSGIRVIYVMKGAIRTLCSKMSRWIYRKRQ